MHSGFGSRGQLDVRLGVWTKSGEIVDQIEIEIAKYHHSFLLFGNFRFEPHRANIFSLSVAPGRSSTVPILLLKLRLPKSGTVSQPSSAQGSDGAWMDRIGTKNA